MLLLFCFVSHLLFIGDTELFMLHLLAEIDRFTSLMGAPECGICNDKIAEATIVKVKYYIGEIPVWIFKIK